MSQYETDEEFFEDKYRLDEEPKYQYKEESEEERDERREYQMLRLERVR
jgi:hypothetical protein